MPKNQIIVAVVGLTGSGKSEAVALFSKKGFVRIGFNDRFYEEFAKSGLVMNEENERKVRERMRQEEGMAVMAKRSLPLIESAIQEGKSVVVESLYSWSEYKLIKEKYDDKFRVLAIYAPPDVRHARLLYRPQRPFSKEDAKSRDYAEIESIEKAGPISMADWTIKNIGTKDEFLHEVDMLLEGLTK
jgi:dephospho-CoA kinase